MAYIKMMLDTNTMKDKIEIYTHEMLISHIFQDVTKDKPLYIDLPCPLRDIIVKIGDMKTPYRLKNAFDIVLERCPRCEMLCIERSCWCYMPNEKLIIKCRYYKDEASTVRGSLEILNILMKCINQLYAISLEKQKLPKRVIRKVDFLEEELTNPCFNAIEASYRSTKLYEKEIKRALKAKVNSNKTITLSLLIKFKDKIKSSFKTISSALHHALKTGHSCLRSCSKRTVILPAQGEKDVKENMEAEYLLYIYQHIDLILDYENVKVRNALNVISELPNNNDLLDFRPLTDGQNSLQNEIRNKYGSVVSLPLENAMKKLVSKDKIENFNHQTRTISLATGDGDREFHKGYEKQTDLINFMVSLYDQIRSKSCKQTKNLMIDTQNKLINAYNDRGSTKIDDKQILEISGECPFSNEKLTGLLINNLSVYKSKTRPLVFEFITEYNNIKKCLYKEQTDLSNDHFFTSLSKYIYSLLDLKYDFYNVLPFNKTCGIVEMIDGKTISSFKSIKELGIELCLPKYSRNKNNEVVEDEGGDEAQTTKVYNFLRSFAAMIIINYLYEIRDRTPDNIIMDKEGRVYNLDYEYCLGKKTKLLTTDIEIPSRMSEFIDSNSSLQDFLYFIIAKYYKIIRKNHQKIMITGKILAIKNLSSVDEQKVKNTLHQRLFLDLDENIASEMFVKICKQSLGNFKTKINEIITKISKTMN